VSLGLIGLHGLLERADLELEADANSSFLALEIALAMLSWSSFSDEAFSSPSISITSSDLTSMMSEPFEKATVMCIDLQERSYGIPTTMS